MGAAGLEGIQLKCDWRWAGDSREWSSKDFRPGHACPNQHDQAKKAEQSDFNTGALQQDACCESSARSDHKPPTSAGVRSAMGSLSSTCSKNAATCIKVQGPWWEWWCVTSNIHKSLSEPSLLS